MKKVMRNNAIRNCFQSDQPCTGIWGCHFLTVPPPARPEDKETSLSGSEEQRYTILSFIQSRKNRYYIRFSF